MKVTSFDSTQMSLVPPDTAALGAVAELCAIRDPYALNLGVDRLFVRAMRETTAWHAQRSPFYCRVLEMHGFTPARLDSVAACAEIPFVLASFFKQHEVLSVPREQIYLHLTSSGTQGQKSQIFFDEWSIRAPQRMLDWIFDYYGWVTPQQTCNYILFTYESESSSRLGTAYTDNYLCKYAPARDVFAALRRTGQASNQTTNQTSHEFDVFGTIDRLVRYAEEGLPVRIFGFPAFLYFTLERMRSLGMPALRLSPDSLVFLGGGWKGHADQQIEKRKLYQLVTETLGIPDERLRDGFGSVEHCIPYVECVRHEFHVPIWSRVFVRDIKTLSPIAYGEKGFLHFVSPYITSVPAHSVLMGDLASLHPAEECGCGLTTPFFRVHGRAGLSKNKSCAVAASQLLKSSDAAPRES